MHRELQLIDKMMSMIKGHSRLCTGKEACLCHIQQIHHKSVQGFHSASAPLLVLQRGYEAAVQCCLQPLQLRLALIRVLRLQGMSSGTALVRCIAQIPERATWAC